MPAPPPASPPQIFSPARRTAQWQRAAARQRRAGAARYLAADMAEDFAERVGFLRHRPARALVIGDISGALAGALAAQGCAVDTPHLGTGFDPEAPYPAAAYDLVASLGWLDRTNDLPGALIHLRQCLAPGGLALASMLGAGSLPALRAAMLAADGVRPAPRLHPMIDVRAAAALLQRAGWADPVVDTRALAIRFRSFDQLVADLRDQAQGNCLARPGPHLDRAGRATAAAHFAAADGGKTTLETFEIITLTGWKR